MEEKADSKKNTDRKVAAILMSLFRKKRGKTYGKKLSAGKQLGLDHVLFTFNSLIL